MSESDFKFTGDVGFYWLNYIPWVFDQVYPRVKVIALTRDRESTICSWVHGKTGQRNPWDQNPRFPSSFPQFKLPLKQSVARWWDLYTERIHLLQTNHPKNVRILPMDDLNDTMKMSWVLHWCGMHGPLNLKPVHENESNWHEHRPIRHTSGGTDLGSFDCSPELPRR